VKEIKREKLIGKTRFIVISVHSETATETMEQKLLRIMSRHILEAEKLSESYQDKPDNRLLCSSE
jgi:hypothetical protein